MSKASEYADVCRAVVAQRPPGMDSKNGNSMAAVSADGNLALYGGTFYPADALRLRDWLTENFGEELTSVFQPSPTDPKPWEWPK